MTVRFLRISRTYRIYVEKKNSNEKKKYEQIAKVRFLNLNVNSIKFDDLDRPRRNYK